VKTEGQIKQKVKQVIFRHRKAFIRRGLARHPENCVYNERVKLPVHMSNRATLHICGYCPDGSTPNNVVCDASMGGDRQAAECPYFEAHRSADVLKEEFNDLLGIDGGAPKEIGFIAKEYPEVAALLWVLGPGKGANSEAPEDEEQQPNILALFGSGEDLGDVPERPLVEDEDES
jgi:hypothetical protein